jgi:hypothetical protein
MLKLALPTAALLALSACKLLGNLPELTLGEDQQIPAISGSTTLDIPEGFACGDEIADPEGKYTITSSGTAEACVFTMKQDVLVLAAEEYEERPELQGATLVKRVEIDVKALSITDDAGAALAPDALDGKAFGVTILTAEDLGAALPFTKTIDGAPIEDLKEIVAAQDDIIIPVDIAMTVNIAPTPPAQIAFTFDAQPNLVFGF